MEKVTEKNRITRPRLSENELGVMVALISKRMHEIKKNSNPKQLTTEYVFLRRLKRKLNKNRKTNSFSYNHEKKIVFVKPPTEPKVTYTSEGIKEIWVQE